MTEHPSSSVETTDILIVGAGPAGLAAALALAKAGFDVVCVDRADPQGPDDDLRTAALLEPAVAMLRDLGVWERLIAAAPPKASELAVMRIMDDAGRGGGAQASVDFDALDIEREVFGWNVANADLRAALRAELAQTSSARLIAPVGLAHLLCREDAALATLSDGHRVRAALVIGADGRNSDVRQRMGIGARRFDYGQQAMVFHVGHARPHGGASIEIYRRGGPFTLVPHGATADGGSRSAVVWMERNAEAKRLMALDDAAFEDAVNDRSLGALGALRLVSERRAWPIISLLADRFIGPRTALIAEAAHVVPPIGAQGLNMSLADAATLARLAIDARIAGRDLGGTEALIRYERARWPDVAARVGATAALDAFAIGPVQPLRDLRALGLRAIHTLAPLRRTAMRLGMGMDPTGVRDRQEATRDSAPRRPTP